MVILDTNIIIDHLRQTGKHKSQLYALVSHKPKEALLLSAVSIQELYEGSSTRDMEKEKDLLAVISPLKILPYTYEIARLAGIIARDHHAPIELADAAIAATAIVYHVPLFTLNTKDFVDIPALELYISE
jgi:tRNA(fMet)-specific endonuclease VapC